MITITAFSGSLRKESFNRILLNNLIDLAPPSVRVHLFDIAPIPFYNEDVEREDYPIVVSQFKELIRGSDGVIIVTPEYNYSIPGVLKNALDWASRPPSDIPFTGKPGAILGTSTSQFGSLRSQLHLRQVCLALGLKLLTSPEIVVPKAKEVFLDNPTLDEKMVARLKKFWTAFVSFCESCP